MEAHREEPAARAAGDAPLAEDRRRRLVGLQKRKDLNHHIVLPDLENNLREDAPRAGRVGVTIAGTGLKLSVTPENLAPLSTKTDPLVHHEVYRADFWLEDSGALRALLGQACPTTFIPEIVDLVLRYLRVKLACHAQVTVADYSSKAPSSPGSTYSFEAACTLEEGVGSCWISDRERQRFAMANALMPEWVVYTLDAGQRRSVHTLGLSIPVLPHGPLSVREFTLETPVDDRDLRADPKALTKWQQHEAHAFCTVDEEGLQAFAITPPIEAAFVRLVCRSNAVGRSDHPVGFWEIRFNCP